VLDIPAFGGDVTVDPESGIGKPRIVAKNSKMAAGCHDDDPVPLDHMMPEGVTGIVPVKSFFQEDRKNGIAGSLCRKTRVGQDQPDFVQGFLVVERNGGRVATGQSKTEHPREKKDNAGPDGDQIDRRPFRKGQYDFL